MKNIIGLILAIMVFSLAIPPVSSAGNPGENTEPDLTGTGIDSISHDQIVVDNNPWSFSVTLNDSAVDDGITVQNVMTQICVNQGLCLAEEPMELTRTGNTWSGESIPHWAECSYSEIDCMVTYVNWKIELNNSDGNVSDLPENGYFTTWSTCWIDTSGNTGGDDCPKSEEEGGLLPGFGIAIGLTSFVAAAIMMRHQS